MIFSPVNIGEELIRERELHNRKEQSLLSEAFGLLKRAGEKDKEILHRLKTPNYDLPQPLALQKFDAKRLFSVDDIHEICTRYRLRFLDSSAFKNDFSFC